MATTSVSFRFDMQIGSGAYGLVYKASENTGRILALKQARAPLRVKRTLLQHEARVLQLLKGHPAIPDVYGYGHLEHFEYLTMELLGSSLRDKWPGSSTRIPLKTAVSVMQQLLSAIAHVHGLGFIHRDIKPENVLCSLDDPSRIKLIDFNLSKPIGSGPPSKYDPISESKTIMGTLHWASLNSMNGIELSPRDDLESLSYVGLFLVRADLPWRNGPITKHEPMKRSIRRIRALKAKWTGAELLLLGPGSEPEFGCLLDYSRGLGFQNIPDYEMWKARFTDLALRTDVVSGEPFDWTPEALPAAIPQISVPSEVLDVDDDDALEQVDLEERHQLGFKQIEPSYRGIDLDCWDFIQGERDLDLTLPLEYKGAMDHLIPKITEVYKSFGK